MSEISPLELPAIQARLERNRRLGPAALKDLPNEVLAKGLDESEPRNVSAVLQGEIENLHEPFEKWLRLQVGIQWIHSRPDMPTTEAVGRPDFGVVSAKGFCWVEFKARPEPEKWLPRERKQKEWAEDCREKDIPYICTNSVWEACQIVGRICLTEAVR